MMNSTRPFIRAILIDLSGTLHIGSSPTPNAVHAFQRLRDADIPIRFCTNTSGESTIALCDRLRKIGFGVKWDDDRKEVWSSLGAVKQLMKDRGLKRRVPYCAN
jgi:ribonucleotide monophosphatase NagD (HAD superfamily)